MIEEEEVNFDAFVGLVESNEKNQAQTKAIKKVLISQFVVELMTKLSFVS